VSHHVSSGLAVVGCGLIGTSVALAARRAHPDLEVVTIDRGDNLGAAAGAEIVVLATPVDTILDLLRESAHHFGGAALVMDTGSTKRAVVAAARSAGLSHFVGGHPMAGGTTPGPAGARADLFDGRPWFLVPDGATPASQERAAIWVATLGATVVRFADDGREHDRIMAAVSHLPQVVASSLMHRVGASLGPGELQWAGGGLRDTTRLAASDASVWASILATNADELRPLLVALADDLRATADRLHDPSAIGALFTSAQWFRNELP
jgi:prephenate dehydrogenase